MLDLAPGISVGQLRHDGFLEGFGIKEGDPAIVGAVDTLGETAKGQTGMESLLQKDPDINIVYSINEPSGFGGANALKAAGKDPKDFILVSVDGGCDAIERGVKPGIIDATSQQYPQNMASQGVETIAKAVRGGKKPSGYVDTGVELITADPAKGVDSQGRRLRHGELLGLGRTRDATRDNARVRGRPVRSPGEVGGAAPAGALGRAACAARPADRLRAGLRVLHDAVGPLPDRHQLLAGLPAGDGDRHAGDRPDDHHPHRRHRPVVRRGDGAWGRS